MEVRRLEGNAGYVVGYVSDNQFRAIVEITDTNRVMLFGTDLQVPDQWATDTRRLVQRWIAHEAIVRFRGEEAEQERARECGRES